MAVYTHLGAEDLAALIAHYDVGELVSAKGIAEGISNSNWLIETTGSGGGSGGDSGGSGGDSGDSNTNGPGQARFILTMYERRIELDDLPYFLGLLDHLSARGCPVPRTIHDREGAAFRMERGKAVALIEFLPGVSPTQPTVGQARSVGEVLAQIHLASADFPLTRANTMGFSHNLATLEACGEAGLASIHEALPAMLPPAREAAAIDMAALPQAQIHADLFPDNVLMLGDTVTGLIDFYFACTGPMALDLAVTHASWSFDFYNKYQPEIGAAIIEGYESVRPLTDAERTALPAIARGATLRFVASRAEDWLDTPDDALVVRKDPMQMVARWKVYEDFGAALFA